MQKIIFFTRFVQKNLSKFRMRNIKKRKHTNDFYNILFIDPCVYELKERSEYSKIDELHKKANNLKQNEFISIDYPNDMNVDKSELFIEKTIENNYRYRNNSQYISTIQSKFMKFSSFTAEANHLARFTNFQKKKIIGVGNLCRIYNIGKGKSNSSKQKLDYLNSVFDFLNKYIQDNGIKWIHLYGIGIELIRIFANLNCQTISIDNTKWTRSQDSARKRKNGVCCRKNTEHFYFWDYMYKIAEISRKSGKKLFF